MAQVQVFKTPKDFDEAVELVGAGVAGPNGAGGIVVERAALSMSELQEQTDEGALKLKDGYPVPLKGKALDAAAKDFVEDRDDLEVVSVPEKEVATLNLEWGDAPERPPAVQVAQEEHDRVFGEQPKTEAEDTASSAASASGPSTTTEKGD